MNEEQVYVKGGSRDRDPGPFSVGLANRHGAKQRRASLIRLVIVRQALSITYHPKGPRSPVRYR